MTPDPIKPDAEHSTDEDFQVRLDDEDLRAIEESERQIDRGEYVEFEEFAARMREKYCRP